MTSARVTLESFDGDGQPRRAQSADYKRGFSDGLLQARDSSEAGLAQAVAEISATLNDMAFGYEEARLQTLETLRPLLAQVADAILPMVAQETFSAHLLDVIERAFQTAIDAPIQIGVAPEILVPITKAHQNDRFTFVSDNAVDSGQALIVQGDTRVLLDLPALLAELQTALLSLEPPERTQSYG